MSNKRKLRARLVSTGDPNPYQPRRAAGRPPPAAAGADAPAPAAAAGAPGRPSWPGWRRTWEPAQPGGRPGGPWSFRGN